MTYSIQPKKDPYTDDQLESDYTATQAKFEATWPAPQPTNSPQPSYVKDSLRYITGTVDAVAAAINTLTGYFGVNGTPEQNGSARYATWGNKHGQIEEIMLNVFAYGIPLPPREDVVTPPLNPTFSESAIQARVNLKPFPQRYDGAACFSDEHWFADASDALAKVLSKPDWDKVPFDTKRALSLTLWLPGQPYYQNFGPADVEGMTAAQVFRKYDVATLPGVPATD